MQLGCLASSFAFILFFGLIGLFVFPSFVIYLIIYPFTSNPQDIFQSISGFIYRLFFILVPKISLRISLPPNLPKSAIYVSTHQSNLDYPILGCFITKYLIMTKINFIKIPFISKIGNLIGIRYLDTDNLSRVYKTYHEFKKKLDNNDNTIFFVEGTRQNSKKLGRFKKGAFRLSKDTNKPVIPVILSNSADILPKGNFCFKTVKKRLLHVEILEPIYPKNFTNEEDMLTFTYNIMQENISRLNNA